MHPALAVALFGVLMGTHARPVQAGGGSAADFGAPPAIRFEVEGFDFGGAPLPITEADAERVLAPFLGTQEGLSGLVEAAEALNAEFQARGFPFHRAVLVPQTVEGGRIALDVTVARLSAVTVAGNRWFDETNVRRTAPGLEVGAVPDVDRLSRALALANQHPSRQVALTLEEGERPGELAARLDVKDQRPWAAFAVANNMGVETTGIARVTVGAQHTNVWNRDHIATLSYTTAPENVSSVTQVALNYRAPLYPLGATVTAYHTRSDVDSGTLEQLGDSFNVSGAGRFTGIAWNQGFLGIRGYRHGATLSLDDRLFISDVTLVGVQTPLLGDARTRPLALRYEGFQRAERWSLGFSLGYARNLPGGSDNSDLAYARSRSSDAIPGARGIPGNDWDAVRGQASAAWYLAGDWQLRAAFEFQWTDEPLIAGERFGIGGMASVRGFEERALQGDRGQRLTLEVQAPRLPFDIRLLAFVDAGQVELTEPGPGEVADDTIVSLGIGARWAWRNHVALALDYGHEVDEAEAADVNGEKLHATLSLRY